MAISTPSTTSLCSLHTSSVNTTDHRPDGRPNQPPISSPATTGFSPQVSPQNTLHSSANGIKTRIPVPHFSIPSTPSPTPQFITSPGRPPAPRFSSPSPSGHSPTLQFSTTPGQTPAQFSSPSSLSPSPEFSTPPCLSPAPQFSTPPCPPMFSVPLQPAAVPFQTPASPQAVSYCSTSSSLSASSLPLYLNGSVGLQSQTSDGIDKSMLDGASPYVLFSAHKVLKQKKLVNISSLGFGALVSPGKEIAQGPQIVQRHPHRCENCGAYSNLYCSIILTSGKWQCVICKNLSGSEGDYVAASREDLQNWSELSLPMVDYIQTVNGRPGFIPVSNSRMSAPVFLIIDECLDEFQLKHLQSSLHAFVDFLHPNTRIGIISYGRTVSVYDFSQGSVASADVLPGDRSPTGESLKALIFGTGIYLAPIHASLTVAHTIFSSMRAIKLYSPEETRDRCIGTAVEVALAIIQGLAEEMSRGMIRRLGGNCRILVCAGGPNTYGPGSVPHSFVHPNYPYMEKMALNYMEHLGHEANQNNTVIDILCAGTCPVRVPILQPLAKASGGVLILHDDFGEVFGINLQRASMRAAGSQGLFEIRCSDDIIVTRVIGPGEEAASNAHETFKNDASTCIQMLSVEETQSFALSMEATSDIKNDHVFFQFAFRYSNVSHADISRVITIRLPAVDSISSYLKSIQDEVAAVLIAKRTVLQAKTSSDVVEMRLNIDKRMKDIAMRFGYRLPMLSFYQLPREICSLPENLFHLRRGPLLGSIVGHEDERLVLRNLFLNASFDLSLRMVAPRCLMHRDRGTFEELPAYDLAMQSDVAVILDHGTDVFIWLGAELATEEGRSAAALVACRTLAEELTEQRFPAPRILAFKEGSSQARYIVSRLIPAHKDPPYEQEARFPQLRSLTAERRARLKISFIHFDDFSFCEWMQSLKLVPPQPA